jgi:hypothetical protein
VPTRVRLVRFLRLLEVEVLVTSMRLIRHPLRAVPRMRQEPLTGQMANYNPRHGRNPFLRPELVERRARGPAGRPNAAPGGARALRGLATGPPLHQQRLLVRVAPVARVIVGHLAGERRLGRARHRAQRVRDQAHRGDENLHL